MQKEDYPAYLEINAPTNIFDPDNIFSKLLLDQLASATSTTLGQLCQPFVRSGHIVELGIKPMMFHRGLLDTGAQGSNFISRQMYSQLPKNITAKSRPTERVVRLGDARSLSVTLEVPLTINIVDSTGQSHQHELMYSVLDNLSHDIIIGLVDLIGPFYDLFFDAVQSSRTLSMTRELCSTLAALTDEVLIHIDQNIPSNILLTSAKVDKYQNTYEGRKKDILKNVKTSIQPLALQDGSIADVLSHPQLGLAYADERVETHFHTLKSMLITAKPGDILQPWSKPIDAIAPEEIETPDPTSFPDDILMLLTTNANQARDVYNIDLKTHVLPEMLAACPEIMTLLTSELAYDVFVPQTWTGIKMPPYHLDVKPGLPEYLKARTRPVREALYQDAKKEFERMKGYFYTKSYSPIACPLVVAPKATAPFIRLCGDYRPVNPFVSIPQEPIPHVQQALTKAAGWKIFVDLDMTNSFHQIPIDDESSNLLSVSTPWGLFRPLFLPEGVGPASGILQSIVRRVFKDFEEWTIVIFDNFLILANDYQDAMLKLEKILQRCKENGLVLKMKKSWIGTDVVTFFGYEVRPGSWQLSQGRKNAISDMIFPTTQKQMQSFLGAANFFRTHIGNYATWSAALYECTAADFKWNPNSWSKDYKALFTQFKNEIQNALILYFPDYSLPWIIRSDSSDHAVGAVLYQVHTNSDGIIINQPISFASHKYSGAATNWDTFKQEAFALYFAVTQFAYYLRGKDFVIETDHRNLIWIENSQVPIVVRWRVLLQSYMFTVKHIPGKENTVADWLSRMHPTSDRNDISNTPTLSAINSLPMPIPAAQTDTAAALPTLQEMFNQIHGGRSLHHGAKRTYMSLCQRYPGHGISMRVIQDLVAECPICQKDRIPLHKIPHNQIRETLMHHRRTIGMDHVTITPHDEDGYIGLLLLVELDTKFPFAYPIRNYNAETVATVLFKHYCTFGSYDSIFSDPGSSFTSDVVKHLNHWLGIPHKVSVIGRHESNGTEHVNALFLGHLRRLVHDERFTHKWASDTVLPLINHALSTLPNDELGGLSPSELKFGTRDYQRFNLPLPLSPGNNYSSVLQQLNSNLATVRSITHEFQSDLRAKRQNLTKKHSQNTYQIGDQILWNPKEHMHSFRSSKLAPKLLGPYTVLNQIKNNITCQHVANDKVHTFHSDRVTPFIGTTQDADKIGLLDREEFEVHSILQHNGNLRLVSSLTFLVRWKGYTSDFDTWEPWAELKHLIPLHTYLRTIGHSNLIPTINRRNK